MQVHEVLLMTFLKNVIIFGVHISSSSRSENRKNNFLILGEGTTYGINGSFGSPEKKFSINFTKANTKCCLSLHCNAHNSYLFVHERKSLNLKLAIKMLTFQVSFFLEVYVIDLVQVILEKYL